MRDRLTARVLLLDGRNRILLMKGRSSAAPDRAAEWFTIGGGVEPGETLAQAAAREIIEESGILDAAVGPVVWRRDLQFHDSRGEAALFREHYLVARCAGAEPDRTGWTEVERALVDDIRWWTLEELRASCEPIHPWDLARLLPPIMAGRYPQPPLVLATAP